MVVSDESVTKCIADIRKALADDTQQIVQTVTRRGFLFQPEVRVGASPSTGSPNAPASPTVPPAKRVSRRILVAGAAARVVLGTAASVRWGRQWINMRPAFEAIAILPFESLSTGPDQQYLADGITEALIINLGQASPLRVIARTSVNQYQKTRKPVRDIARELNVDVVLEGTITQLHDRIRVTANWIRVSPEMHLWARSYERKLGDMLALQVEITSAIAEEIRGKVAPHRPPRVSGSRSENPEAQLARWKARFFIHSRRTPESAKKSLEYAQQAVGLAPDSAEAHAVLAHSYAMLTYMGVMPGAEARRSANAAAERAILLDPNLADGHSALGQVLFLYDRNVAGTRLAFERALALNPSDADAGMNLAGCLAALGHVDEAVSEMRRARRLDLFSFLINRKSEGCCITPAGMTRRWPNSDRPQSCSPTPVPRNGGW